MTGVALLVCCGWTVLLPLSVQAYENLALLQPAWQSSTWSSDTRADRAVDGLYTNLEWDGGQCAGSDWYKTTAEWRVDLGGVRNIHHVFLQHATGFLRSVFLGFSVYISNTTYKEDGVLCFRDTNYTSATIPDPANIICPYHGRYVIYYNNRTHPTYLEGYSQYAYIALCEVEVYDCPSPGYYGKNCSLLCPQNCLDGYCDSVEGTCLSCKPGFIGPRCDLGMDVICRTFQNETNPPKQQSIDEGVIKCRSSTLRKQESKLATSSEIFTVYNHILPYNLDIFHQGGILETDTGQLRVCTEDTGATYTIPSWNYCLNIELFAGTAGSCSSVWETFHEVAGNVLVPSTAVESTHSQRKAKQQLQLLLLF